jgi:subtilisin family serine protease
LRKNFTVDPPDNNTDDDNGHGTLVAGVAAAKKIPWVFRDDRNTIYAGVSEGAGVVPIKVLDKNGEGWWSNVVAALNYITSKGRTDDVINLSLGDYQEGDIHCRRRIEGLKETLTDLARANFVVIASGNDLGNTDYSTPACIDIFPPQAKKLYTVAAVTCGKQCALFSNYGKRVDYVAVGTDVFSTYLYDPLTGKWTFVVASGTSISAGIISGVIHALGDKPIASKNVRCTTLPREDKFKPYPYGRRIP